MAKSYIHELGDRLSNGFTADNLPKHIKEIAPIMYNDGSNNFNSIQSALNGKAESSHTHGNITNDGKIGTTANLVVVTGTSGGVTTADLTTASPTVPTSGTTTSLEFIDTVAQDSKGKISATKKAVPVDSTYSSTGTNPVNGKAVAAAIGGLEVSSVGGDGMYISAISETDGKIAATATTMDTTPTANSTKAVTSGGIKAALDGKSSSSHAHDDRYIRASSGNKSLSFGDTTTLGTVNGVNVNLVMPKANADTYDVNFGSTSFADALTAFNSNKKLILKVGKAGSGAYSTAYYLPLYRLQFYGKDITEFVWMLDSDAYGDASDSNTYGAIYIYKLSKSGWSSSSDNVEYAKAAGTANGGVADYLKFQNNNEVNFKNVPTGGNKSRFWFNYLNGDTNAADSANPIKDYYFGDRNNGTNTTLHANRLVGSADKWNGWSIVVGSTGSDANTLYFV